jgi:transposase InsO family protein
MPDRDQPLLQAITDVIATHPTWGIRLIHGWLCGQGLAVSFSKLRRVYRQSGYAAQWRRRRKKIRRQQRVNPVAVRPHDVWCMDFAEDRLINGRRFMALLVKDEATAFGLAIRVAPSLKAVDLESVLDELVAKHGSPSFIRSDNGGQYISFTIQRWAQRRNITLAYIQPGKPWQNGFAESFVGTYRTEVLNAEVFHSINESDVVSRSWLHMYNHERPHSKHNYLPPVSAFTTCAA